MIINKVIETPDGTVKFEGEIDGEELEVVVAAGLNYLMHAGALPIIVDGDNIHMPEDPSIQ